MSDLPPIDSAEMCSVFRRNFAAKADSCAISILMADDDEDDRLLAADALQRAHIINPLFCVTDGEELMDYLRLRGKYTSSIVAPRPGIILLDLNMPRKDGREALQEIKRDPDLRSIPVVVFTTSETPEDVERVYAMGGNSYISKPVTFEGLVSTLKTLGEFWFQAARLPGVTP